MAEQQREDIFEAVKEKNHIEDVINEDGYELGGMKGHYMKCRQHDSLVVDVQKQCYHWNAKGEHGDVINWRMNRLGVDAKGAVEGLARRAKMAEPNWGRQDPAVRMAARAREDAFNVAASVFHAWLMGNAEALSYARGRGWTDETLAEANVGYTGAGSSRRELAEELKGALIAQGVDVQSPAAVALLGMQGDVASWAKDHGVKVDEKHAADRYLPGLLGKDMLVYPHMVRGRVVYFSGRGVHEKGHFNLVEALVGERQPYFNTAWNHNAAEVVIVEGQADAITLGQWGIAAVGLAGTVAGIGLTDELKNQKVHYLALDEDDAGRKNTPVVAKMFGPMVRIAHWGELVNLSATTGGDSGAAADGAASELVNEDAAAEEEEEGGAGGLASEDGESAKASAGGGQMQGTALMGEGGKLGGAGGAVVQEKAAGVKDANELLQAWVKAGISTEEQVRRVRAGLTLARTFVEWTCEQAGLADGAQRDGAQHEALKLVAKLEKVQLAQYRTRLAKMLKLTVRDFDNILKSIKDSKERLTGDLEPIYMFGGCINGWLVEYIYDIESKRAALAWRDEEGVVSSGPEVVIEGRRYLPWPPTNSLENGAIIFPSAVGEKRSIRELVAYIEMYLKKIYILPSDRMARLIAYWVLSTWIYDSFETVVYLRAMGGAGSGKSELMKRIGLLCYRMMTASGAASTSALFRSLERYKGCVFIDEADIQNSDTEADMVKFYNSGAMKGNPIWRTVEVTGPNGQKDWEEQSFQTFCPKLVAMRKEFKDDAIGSRSMTIKLVPREMMELMAAGVPLTINETIRAQALGIRNLLLRWRLDTWQKEISVDPLFYDMSVSARLNQVAGPLLAIAKDDKEQQEDVRQTLREYYAESIITQSMTIGARVLEAMWKIWKYPDLHKDNVKLTAEGQSLIKVGQICTIANAIIDEMNGEKDDEEDGKRPQGLKPQRVGGIIRGEFAMQMSQRMRDGFWVYWNEPRMLGLSMKYGIKPEDFGPKEGSGQPSAGNNQPKAQQGSLV